MEGNDRICAEVFLENQEQLLDEPVAETLEEAVAFLEDCFAQVLDHVDDVREYFEENGMDTSGMSDDDILDASEVFELPTGQYLVVEA